MGKIEENSRRLHPRLRVLRNSDQWVNAGRAQISTTVVSTADPAKAKLRKDRATVDLMAAQRAVRKLAGDVPEIGAGRPAKPGRMRTRPKPDQAFVNVFIEFQRPRLDPAGDASEGALKRVEARIGKALQRTAAAKVKAAVLRSRNFIAATVPVSLLPELEAEPSIAFVHPAEPLRFDLPETADATQPTPRAVEHAALHRNGKGVLIGIIDVGGFDFAHPDFLDGRGNTRFLSIWDQGGELRPPPTRIDRRFSYGAEFTKAHMDAALKASRRRRGLPATLIEQQSQREESSHGTHVASIAAGNRGVCPEAKIAAVLIDVPQPADTREQRRFTFSDSSRIAHAVEYLHRIAEQEKLPLSINISLGTNGGAHDGSAGVSRWLDALLATPGRAIAAAAGNAGQEGATSADDFGWIMGRIHTSGRIASRGLDVDLEWIVVGNGLLDISENELEIWYGAQDRFAVLLRPPGETEWIEVKPRQFVENRPLRSGTFVSIYNELYHPTNGANYIAVYLSPNLQPGNIRGIQAGTWTVRLRGEEVRDGSFHAWVERDDPMEVGEEGGQRLFRFPSFFSAASNVDSHSLSSLACANRVIAVANLDARAQKIAVSSSQGPTRDSRLKPEIAAPGTDIVAANGFAPADRPWVAMSGTSMASPYVAGAVGLMLSANPDLTAAQCLGILQRTARPLPGASYAWRNDAGFGQIDAKEAVQEAASFNMHEELP